AGERFSATSGLPIVANMSATGSVTPDLVVSGRLRRSDGSWGAGEVWIAGETIVAVEEEPRAGSAPGARRIDAGSGLVLPGAVDSHVHSLSHHGEGIATSTRSAAAGGVTTIVEMPFDEKGPINSRDRLLAKQDVAA